MVTILIRNVTQGMYEALMPLLRSARYKVLTADDRRQMLDAFEHHHVDILMIGSAGDTRQMGSAILEAKRCVRELRVIALCSGDEEAGGRPMEMAKANADFVLSGPFSDADLYAAVLECSAFRHGIPA